MNYQLEKSEGKVKFTFTITPNEWEEEVNNAYIRSKNRFNVPGFRKGHAPRKTIENYYGKGVFFDDAINNCVKKSYSKALDENADVYPVDEPKVDIEKFDESEIKFTLEVTVKPEVKLGAYTGINLEKVEYTVKQDEVKSRIELDRKAHTRKIEIKDRTVKDGDKLTIDYTGKINGVKFEGGSAEKQELLIGSKTFIPGFEEQLVGMNIGETKDITVKFPDDYHAKDLAGKDAVFTVKVCSGIVEEIPEENDDFAQEMGPYETFADYKKDIEKQLKEAAKNRAKLAEENNLIEAIVANAEFTVPDCMVETELNYELNDFANRLSNSGIKIKDYFKYMGSNVEEFKSERRNDALTTVKTRLVIEALMKELKDSGKINVTDQEVEDKIKEFSEKVKLTVEDIKKTGQEEYIRNELLMDKLIKYLTENNTFTKAAPKAKKTDKKAESQEEATSEEKPLKEKEEKPKTQRTKKTENK